MKYLFYHVPYEVLKKGRFEMYYHQYISKQDIDKIWQKYFRILSYLENDRSRLSDHLPSFGTLSACFCICICLSLSVFVSHCMPNSVSLSRSVCLLPPSLLFSFHTQHTHTNARMHTLNHARTHAHTHVFVYAYTDKMICNYFSIHEL